MTVKVDRRQVIAYGLGVAGALAMPSIVRAQPRSIVVATPGGQNEEALIQSVFRPWQDKTGIEVIPATTTYAKVKAMVDTNSVEWDLFLGAGGTIATFGIEGLLEPIDYGVVDAAPLVEGRAAKYSVQQNIAASVIGWNTDAVPSGQSPNSWRDFWDLEKFPGQRGLWQQPFETLEEALLADGVPGDQLYPLDIDRAFRSLDRIKANIYWWTSGAQGAQLLIDGEVPISKGWNGRLFGPKAEGAPIDFTFNDAMLVGDCWAIVKGAPNIQLAQEFLAFTMEAKQQAEYCKLIAYGPVNRDALELIPEERLQQVPSIGRNVENPVFQDYTWWAQNGQAVTERFNQWLLS